MEKDIPDIAALHVAGWQEAYGGMVDQAYLDSLSVEKRMEEWQIWLATGESDVFLAKLDGVAAGFIMCGRTKTPPPGSSNIRPTHSAEIYAIYLKPEFFRQGIGAALMKKSVACLKEKKHKTLCLWVLGGNKRACQFYEAMGGQRIGKKIIEVGSSKVKEVCYGWRDIEEILEK